MKNSAWIGLSIAALLIVLTGVGYIITDKTYYCPATGAVMECNRFSASGNRCYPNMLNNSGYQDCLNWTKVNAGFKKSENENIIAYIKSYDSKSKTVILKDISAKNVANITLNTPAVYNVIRGKDRLVAEFTICNAEDYNSLFDNMEFYDLKQNNRSITRVFTYKIKNITGQKETPIYQEICTPTGIGNKTNCIQNKTGTRYDDIIEWKFLNTNALPKGTTTIGIFTDVLAGDKIEWIPTMFKTRINEWAVWTDGLNTNLMAYWKFNESSGTTSIDSYGSNNLGNMENSWFPGLIGNAYFPTGKPVNTSIIMYGATNLTVNFWINSTALPSSKEIVTDTTLEIYTTAAAHRVDVYIGGSIASCTIILGSWNMVTVIVNTTGAREYVNGIYCGEIIHSFTFANHNLTLFGYPSDYSPDSWLSNSYIDEMSMWNRGLTATEITQLYNGGAGMTYSLSSPFIIGYTKDGNGNFLENIRVIIINQKTNQSAGTTTSNESGYWSYQISSGNYTVIGYDASNSSRVGAIKTFILVP